MQYTEYGLDRKLREYAKTREETFKQVLDVLLHTDKDDNEYVTAKENEKKFLKAVSNIPADKLNAENGALLCAAAKRNLSHTATYLLRQNTIWPPATIRTAVNIAAENNNAATLLSILKHADIKDNATFSDIYEGACKNATDHSAKKALEEYQERTLGKNWEIQDSYRISHVETDYYTSPQIRTTFNFRACHVRTIIRDKDLNQMEVRERDFQDFQSSAEIDLAYEKLTRFISNAPEYRGKNTGQTQQRRIKSRGQNLKT